MVANVFSLVLVHFYAVTRVLLRYSECFFMHCYSGFNFIVVFSSLLGPFQGVKGGF